MKPKPPVPVWRWVAWSATLSAALFVFYVLFTPFWIATRALAWLADFRARRKPGYRPPVGAAEESEGAAGAAPSEAFDR
jgi:hypothetical protein